jgi:hypothetical protein
MEIVGLRKRTAGEKKQGWVREWWWGLAAFSSMAFKASKLFYVIVISHEKMRKKDSSLAYLAKLAPFKAAALVGLTGRLLLVRSVTAWWSWRREG